MKSAGEDPAPLVFIVIPIHNGLAHTRKCLAGISHLRYTQRRTIVVDDGSNDGSSEYIASHHPDVILLKGDGSLWWSGAVNLGVRHALENGADYICLLNNDNWFSPDFLDHLTRTAIREKAECVCSKVFHPDGERVFFAGGTTNALGELKMRQGLDTPELDIAGEVQWAGGMGVLFDAGVFQPLGFFDEKNFPQYFGDADFSYRLRKAGARIFFQPESVVYNDTAHTGHSYRTGKFHDLRLTLFSKKSHLNVFISAKFYFKYSPCTAPIIMARRLARIFGGYLKALTRRMMAPQA